MDDVSILQLRCSMFKLNCWVFPSARQVCWLDWTLVLIATCFFLREWQMISLMEKGHLVICLLTWILESCIDVVLDSTCPSPWLHQGLFLHSNYFYRCCLTGQFARDCCPRFLEEPRFNELKVKLNLNVIHRFRLVHVSWRARRAKNYCPWLSQAELAKGERLLIRTGSFVDELNKRSYSKVLHDRCSVPDNLKGMNTIPDIDGWF